MLLHRWLGVGIGLWFALVGLTGAALVFEDAIDATLNPHLLRDARDGTWLPPAAIVERASRAFPDGRVERMRTPQTAGEVYRLEVRVSPRMRVGSPRLEATFSPVTGELLGTRDPRAVGLDTASFVNTVYEFHRNVLLGPTGTDIVGTAGLLLMTSTITGIVLALPRTRGGWRRVVAVRLRASITRLLFDLHRSAGTLLAVLLLLATATGVTLVWVNHARSVVGLFSPVAPFPVVPWIGGTDLPWPGLEQLATSIREAYPRHTVTEVRIPSRPTAGYVFYLRAPGDAHRLGDTLVWLHPGTGERLLERGPDSRSAGEAFMHWLFPLHSGTAFGLVGRVAMCATGIAPTLLVGTGLWLWLRKRRAQRIRRHRRGRAVA
ncbi:MAG: PepSY domain-containing protein [Ectothiorhodospiraceae bacterium]|nr:PepSY domain-containing protein [Ectothiorhodospiraceae bacterium]